MIFKGIKGLIKSNRLTGHSLNLGFIGLNFAGSSSYVNDVNNIQGKVLICEQEYVLYAIKIKS